AAMASTSKTAPCANCCAWTSLAGRRRPSKWPPTSTSSAFPRSRRCAPASAPWPEAPAPGDREGRREPPSVAVDAGLFEHRPARGELRLVALPARQCAGVHAGPDLHRAGRGDRRGILLERQAGVVPFQPAVRDERAAAGFLRRHQGLVAYFVD